MVTILDEVDKKLLTKIRNEGEVSISYLCKEIFLSSDAIRIRLDRLENERLVYHYKKTNIADSRPFFYSLSDKFDKDALDEILDKAFSPSSYLKKLSETQLIVLTSLSVTKEKTSSDLAKIAKIKATSCRSVLDKFLRTDVVERSKVKGSRAFLYSIGKKISREDCFTELRRRKLLKNFSDLFFPPLNCSNKINQDKVSMQLNPRNYDALHEVTKKVVCYLLSNYQLVDSFSVREISKGMNIKPANLNYHIKKIKQYEWIKLDPESSEKRKRYILCHELSSEMHQHLGLALPDFNSTKSIKAPDLATYNNSDKFMSNGHRDRNDKTCSEYGSNYVQNAESIKYFSSSEDIKSSQELIKDFQKLVNLKKDLARIQHNFVEVKNNLVEQYGEEFDCLYQSIYPTESF